LRKYVSPDANDTFIITRGFEKCLFVYPYDEWIKIEQNLRVLSTYNAEHRLFLRSLLDSVFECQLDSQARITIPQDLREYAGIESDARIIGVLDKIEIWNPKIYQDYLSAQTDTYEIIAAKVMKQQ
jgi:MraZ protein